MGHEGPDPGPEANRINREKGSAGRERKQSSEFAWSSGKPHSKGPLATFSSVFSPHRTAKLPGPSSSARLLSSAKSKSKKSLLSFVNFLASGF